MTFHFSRQARPTPELTFNLGTTENKLSIAPEGIKRTSGESGTRARVDQPGTSLYLSEKIQAKQTPQNQETNTTPSKHTTIPNHPETPENEASFINGCQIIAESKLEASTPQPTSASKPEADASQPASASKLEADASKSASASKSEADASQPASASKLEADASKSASASKPEADAPQSASASKLKADASQSASKSNQETDAHQPNSKSNSEKAYQHFSQATDLADGAFMAGYLACLNNEHLKAIDHFKTAIEKSTTLGNHFNQYKISLQIKLSISDDIEAIIIPDHRGAILGLIEAYQASKNYTQAINHLQALRKTNPKDNLILLALVEMLYEHKPGNKANLKRIDTITNDCENTNFIECAILLYRAKALIALSQTLAARDTLTLALRKRKNCPTPLRHALLHKRAATFEALNQIARAQADLQSIHTENPNYEDVSKRLEI